jgi:hypothetical protein
MHCQVHPLGTTMNPDKGPTVGPLAEGLVTLLAS